MLRNIYGRATVYFTMHEIICIESLDISGDFERLMRKTVEQFTTENRKLIPRGDANNDKLIRERLRLRKDDR